MSEIQEGELALKEPNAAATDTWSNDTLAGKVDWGKGQELANVLKQRAILS